MTYNKSFPQQEALIAAVRKAVCQFQLEFMAGSFAERIRVHIALDMMVVRSHGVLPTAEQKLIHTEEGRALVKQLASVLPAELAGGATADATVRFSAAAEPRLPYLVWTGQTPGSISAVWALTPEGLAPPEQ
mgnify:CR=1 FL=1